MACAYYLAEKGYPVTVFDRNPVPGGMLTLGIPSFRLEKDVLNAEIDILREMGVALINGLVWGGIMGGITWWLYDDMALGGVMMLAMVLNLLVASMMGVIIPLTMTKLGRDPAVGSSVMITAITDTGGFFIFLGLATIFLL